MQEPGRPKLGSIKRKDRWLVPKGSGMPGWRGPEAAVKVSKPMIWKGWVLQVAFEVVLKLLYGKASIVGRAGAPRVIKVERRMFGM